MNFTKTTSYSLNVLSYLAKHENVKMSAIYLHKKLGIPYSYLRQVLSGLSKKGFIDSNRGTRGGFVISRDISNIYLADIIEATEGLDSLNRCIMGFSKCPFNYACSIHPVWVEMRSNILKVLKNTSLADLNINYKQ
jgi:Rrf2 family protein